MDAQNLTLVRGMDDTRAALARWSERPWPGIGEWVVKSFVIAVGLLLAVYVIASLSTPDPTPLEIAGVTERLGSGTSARSPFATRWCSRCTPSRAWPGYRRLVDAARGGATQRGLEGGPRLGGNTGDLVRHPRHPLSDHA